MKLSTGVGEWDEIMQLLGDSANEYRAIIRWEATIYQKALAIEWPHPKA